MAISITEEQKSTITNWVREGLGLSDIQKRVREELDLSMTYMEVRFLIDDLNLELADNRQADAPAPSDALDTEPEPAPGGVSVEVDRVVQPGAVASGNVTFSDGMKATWGIDNYGRLMLQAEQKGYKPSQEDVETFQRELQRHLESGGAI